MIQACYAFSIFLAFIPIALLSIIDNYIIKLIVILVIWPIIMLLICRMINGSRIPCKIILYRPYKIRREIIRCDICIGERYPILILRCNHEICRDCYNKIKGDDSMKCPYCRTIYNV